MTDAELIEASQSGGHGLGPVIEQTRRLEPFARTSGETMRLPASPSIPIIPFLLLAVPLLVVYLLVTALASGVSAIANDSLLAPLFPRPGDSLARYVLSVSTLLAILPGGLIATASALRGRRLHFLRRLVLYPLAFLLVPTILMMTTVTTTADMIRLPS